MRCRAQHGLESLLLADGSHELTPSHRTRASLAHKGRCSGVGEQTLTAAAAFLSWLRGSLGFDGDGVTRLITSHRVSCQGQAPGHTCDLNQFIPGVGKRTPGRAQPRRAHHEA